MEIIDHHENLDLFAKDQKISKLIKKSGSCCSILAEIIEDSEQNLDSLPEPLLFGLFVTILMDTMNFEPKLKENRWVEKDFELFKRLSGILSKSLEFQKKISDIDGLYRELLNLKYSEKQNLMLPLDLIFAKDRKTFHYEFGKVDFATIFVNPLSFLNGYGEKTLKEFVAKKLTEEGFLACILLFVYPDKNDNLFRDFLAFSWKKEFLGKIKESFDENGMKMKERNLEFKEFSKDFFIFVNDEERIYSRKLLEPIISKLKF